MNARMKGPMMNGIIIVGFLAVMYGSKTLMPLITSVYHPQRSTFLIGFRPLKCYGNQEIHVKGTNVRSNEKNFTIARDGTITAMGGCHVFVEDSHLTAENPIIAFDNAIVTVKNSEIDCGGGDCISASGHAKVELDHATIRANSRAKDCTTCDTAKSLPGGTGVSVAQHASLVMTGGLVDGGGGAALDGRDDAHLELHDAELRSKLVVDKWGNGDGDGLELRDRAHAELFGGKLEASQSTVWMESDSTAVLHATKLEGGWHAPNTKNLKRLPK